jgi:hypothetical protein
MSADTPLPANDNLDGLATLFTELDLDLSERTRDDEFLGSPNARSDPQSKVRFHAPRAPGH